MNAQAISSSDSIGSHAAAAPGQYLTFGLAGELFAIPILAVQEIRGWETVSRTPRSPAYVLGVMNLRGAVVPVFDLRARLGMPLSERTSTSVVVVVRVETTKSVAATVGCLVDGVSDVINVAADSARTTPSACGTVDTHFLSGVATIDRQLVMLLDVVRLIETSIDITADATAAA
jgi:purine-binding chemotaxis protein CheW